MLALVLCLSAPASHGLPTGDCDEFVRGDERSLPGELVPYLGSPWQFRALPSRGDLDAVLTDLDSNDKGPLVYPTDLNGDGRAELLLTTPDARLCGSAGCPYALLDPRTLRRLGKFFGHLAILDERVNGYRLVQSWSREQAGYSTLDTYVFDRGGYRLVSHALIDGCGLERWRARMRTPK